MQVRIARWGNSLGLSIPKDIASRAGLCEGARVEVEAEGTGSSSRGFSNGGQTRSRHR